MLTSDTCWQSPFVIMADRWSQGKDSASNTHEPSQPLLFALALGSTLPCPAVDAPHLPRRRVGCQRGQKQVEEHRAHELQCQARPGSRQQQAGAGRCTRDPLHRACHGVDDQRARAGVCAHIAHTGGKQELWLCNHVAPPSPSPNPTPTPTLSPSPTWPASLSSLKGSAVRNWPATQRHSARARLGVPGRAASWAHAC